jgi:thymidylate synthase
MREKQKILVFEQNGSGQSKIAGIRRFGGDRFILETISIEAALPPVVDDGRDYLPDDIEADLVLDYLKHPDLCHDLALLCREKGIPVVASRKKTRLEGAITPPTCCGLGHIEGLGEYGDRFGMPEFAVALKNGRIQRIDILRGAPCGASWEAAEKVTGMPVEDAVIRMGLETQYFCSADGADWDPIGGKSPIHFAGDVHAAALEKAIKKAMQT